MFTWNPINRNNNKSQHETYGTVLQEVALHRLWVCVCVCVVTCNGPVSPPGCGIHLNKTLTKDAWWTNTVFHFHCANTASVPHNLSFLFNCNSFELWLSPAIGVPFSDWERTENPIASDSSRDSGPWFPPSELYSSFTSCHWALIGHSKEHDAGCLRPYLFPTLTPIRMKHVKIGFQYCLTAYKNSHFSELVVLYSFVFLTWKIIELFRAAHGVCLKWSNNIRNLLASSVMFFFSRSLSQQLNLNNVCRTKDRTTAI